MDIRYSANQRDFMRYTTRQVRDEFLVQNIFIPGKITSVYSHADRMIIMGSMPTEKALILGNGEELRALGTGYFLERREMGIFNIGEPGIIIADGAEYPMEGRDCLYLPRETGSVVFKSADKNKPAKYYMVSAPAHKALSVKHIPFAQAKKIPVGEASNATKRIISQYIHPDVVETCQLMMGMTKLEPGSVWNTMPAHTHERRMEIYLYFDFPEDQAVVHLCGEGGETRNIMVHNEEAVISPSWSIHSGVGTAGYAFIWAMGGENQSFNDMDHIRTVDLR